MSNSNSTIGALVLIPIVIAFGAAFLALKTAGLFSYIYKYINPRWHRLKRWCTWNDEERVRKIRKTNLRTSRTYGDSWDDLESVRSSPDPYSRFIGQSPRKSKSSGVRTLKVQSSGSWDKDDIPGPQPVTPQIWHPSRSTRLAWSFTNPRSPNPSRFELSSVVRRSPAFRYQEKSEIEAPLFPPTKAKVAHHSGQIGL